MPQKGCFGYMFCYIFIYIFIYTFTVFGPANLWVNFVSVSEAVCEGRGTLLPPTTLRFGLFPVEQTRALVIPG